MKRLLFVLMCVALTGMATADLGISNGDFEADAVQTSNVTGWFDTVTVNTNNWWESTWAGPTVSPTGSSVLGLSYMFTTTNWAYQSIGVNDAALASVPVGFKLGSFTDAGSARDLGVAISVYQAASFVGADNVDIAADPGVTLIDSVSFNAVLDPGAWIWKSGVLDLSSANTTDELFIRLENFAGTVGEPWTAVDNLSIPEPATMALLGLGALVLRRKG